MKRRWLYLLLAVSLAGNAVELGVFAYRKRMYWWSKPETYGDGGGDGGATRGHLHASVESYEPRLDSIRGRLTRLRDELDWQSLQDSPDSVRVELALDSTAELRRAMYRQLLSARKELARVADQKVRARQERRWRQQMGMDQR